MKVTYRFYDSSDFTILPQYFYESDHWWCTDSTILPILRLLYVSFLCSRLKNEVYIWFAFTPRSVDVIFSDLAIIL